MITVVMLTRNEARHIERALDSVRPFADRIFVVDSGSTDETVALAQSRGAEVRVNPWVNYGTQFNWALDQLPDDTDWILRLDADEFVTERLQQEIGTRLATLGPEIAGVHVPRRIQFLGRPITWGGVGPRPMLRLFRYGRGRCENRWMDEHILVEGATIHFRGVLVDDNRNTLSWWIDKHNAYACREAVDLLNLKYGFAPRDSVADLRQAQASGMRRWIKEHIYAPLPPGFRAFLYFFYRYVLRLGFLDGKEGRAFHVLQGFWYRYLVDMKVLEVERRIRRCGQDPKSAIQDVLGIDLTGRELTR